MIDLDKLSGVPPNDSARYCFPFAVYADAFELDIAGSVVSHKVCHRF